MECECSHLSDFSVVLDTADYIRATTQVGPSATADTCNGWQRPVVHIKQLTLEMGRVPGRILKGYTNHVKTGWDSRVLTASLK